MPEILYFSSRYLFVVLFLGLVLHLFPVNGQSGTTQTRETYYQNLEERARRLSQKLAEISGTEPVPFQQPKRSVLSTMESQQSTPVNTPQSAYDALPGPVIEPEPTKPTPQSETLYRADGTPVILQPAQTTSPAIANSGEVKSTPKKRSIRRNMEKERGSYFIQPFLGVAIPPSAQSYKGAFLRDATIETEIGHALGLSFGRRWDNLEGEIHFGYLNSNYGEISIPGTLVPLDAEGQLESFQIGTRIGYAIPFGEKGWFRTAGGFGFANRRDVLNIQIPLTNNSAYISSETAFTYDLLLGLGYEVGLGLDGFLAYRLLGISDNGDFDSVTMHLFQVGLGANF